MEVFQELLGNDIQTKQGIKKTAECLAGKRYVGLYFSAHWCPPCRGFTPVLIEFYNKMKDRENLLEIIFISSDKDQGAFDKYYGEMPWCALQYSDRTMKNQVSTKYGIQGIPTFVLLNDKGETVEKKAREKVQDNPDDFPWDVQQPQQQQQQQY